MKIAPIMKEELESTTHIFLVDKKECEIFINVFTEYCKQNKRMKKAKTLLNQFNNELQIY